MGWQPIETAPKDDRDVLVYTDEDETVVAALASIGYIESFSGGYYAVTGVTHWMPLPEAP